MQIRFTIGYLVFMVICDNLHAQIAADKCKFIGNIIAGSTPGDFTTYWNQVTPENAGKWQSVEGTRDVMDWSQLDNAYNTAKDNGLPFRQHTLVWGQQQPAWITTLTEEEQRQEVEEWISAYCERYPDTDFIDVVNEPLHAQPAYKVALGGNGTTGWDWVVWAFEKTRQHCPNAQLFLNDYNIINNGAATVDYIRIIDILNARGLIDGVGEQGHFLESTPLATIKSNLKAIAETGLPIHITELDIDIANDSQQKQRYEELFPILWLHPSVHGITLWGYRENEIWRTNAYLKRANGTERPAFTWLKDYIEYSTGGTLCSPVSVEDTHYDLDVFPNPAKDGRFEIGLAEEGWSLRIIDSIGAEVESRLLHHGPNVIWVQDPGLYFLVFSKGNRRMNRKIVMR